MCSVAPSTKMSNDYTGLGNLQETHQKTACLDRSGTMSGDFNGQVNSPEIDPKTVNSDPSGSAETQQCNPPADKIIQNVTPHRESYRAFSSVQPNLYLPQPPNTQSGQIPASVTRVKESIHTNEHVTVSQSNVPAQMPQSEHLQPAFSQLLPPSSSSSLSFPTERPDVPKEEEEKRTGNFTSGSSTAEVIATSLLYQSSTQNNKKGQDCLKKLVSERIN